MLSKFFNKKSRGFTLVELLIVVAIIGVLSTLGVPTFRRMIQKSKKSEAKVNLGALFTAESAFQAEYNTYGNNLGRIGFEIDGTPANLIYRIGFFGTGGSCDGMSAVKPDSSSAAGTSLNSAFPGYYSGTWATSNAYAGYSGINGSNCNASTFTVADAGTSYTAAAQGVISPNYSRTNPTAATQIDVWSIDNNRLLVNLNDGVN